jgi:hypothetical protein
MTKRLSLIKALEIPMLTCDIWEIKYKATHESIFEIKFIPFELIANTNSKAFILNKKKLMNVNGSSYINYFKHIVRSRNTKSAIYLKLGCRR